METITIKPRNKKELELVISIMKHLSIPTSLSENKAAAKKKAKEAFLNSLEDRLKEVQQHIEGKVKLKSWDELYKEL
jgi:hypothetical protein